MRMGWASAGLGALALVVLGVSAEVGTVGDVCAASPAIRLTTSCATLVEASGVTLESWELPRRVPRRLLGAEVEGVWLGCPDPMRRSSDCPLPGEVDRPVSTFRVRGFGAEEVLAWPDYPYVGNVILLPYDGERRAYVMSRKLQRLLSTFYPQPIPDDVVVRPRER